ncbi:hypothetical protein PAPYR_6489 [Paratrimastix pyriformis]|uniref:Uncharacterized protein n=1 Tax=Paratrimastix pyriformis TaxID=342808 RepID=A0ABQ8UKG1_9EUKA|nr:hypothetical protein PAPYR_6489 [Paratrimastix pyriformis]
MYGLAKSAGGKSRQASPNRRHPHHRHPSDLPPPAIGPKAPPTGLPGTAPPGDGFHAGLGHLGPGTGMGGILSAPGEACAHKGFPGSPLPAPSPVGGRMAPGASLAPQTLAPRGYWPASALGGRSPSDEEAAALLLGRAEVAALGGPADLPTGALALGAEREPVPLVVQADAMPPPHPASLPLAEPLSLSLSLPLPLPTSASSSSSSLMAVPGAPEAEATPPSLQTPSGAQSPLAPPTPPTLFSPDGGAGTAQLHYPTARYPSLFPSAMAAPRFPLGGPRSPVMPPAPSPSPSPTSSPDFFFVDTAATPAIQFGQLQLGPPGRPPEGSPPPGPPRSVMQAPLARPASRAVLPRPPSAISPAMLPRLPPRGATASPSPADSAAPSPLLPPSLPDLPGDTIAS